MNLLQANSPLGRALHHSLYQRMTAFAASLTPEVPAEQVVTAWLSRFYTNDPLLQILVDLDENMTITTHALVEIHLAFGAPIITCHQYQNDTADITKLDELVEYGKKLKAETNAACMSFSVAKNAKAYERRYGFHAVRTIMLYYGSPDDATDESDPEEPLA